MPSRADELRQESFQITGSDLPRFLTPQQFCEATAMGESTVRAWIAEGKVAALSPNGGASLRIPITEITRVFLPVAPAEDRPARRRPGSKTKVETNGQHER